MMNQMSKGNMKGLDGLMGGGDSGKLGKMAMNSMVRKQKAEQEKRLKRPSDSIHNQNNFLCKEKRLYSLKYFCYAIKVDK